MRKLLSTIGFMALLMQMSYAQVHIQPTMPTVGLVQKNQLWNLVLVNGTGTAMNGRLDIVLRDRQDGRELLTATTRSFSLPKGSLSVNVNTLNPIQYNYIGMEPDRTLNNLLPAGAYVACYSFTRFIGDKVEEASEECVSFDTEPLSPPMLLFPADSSVLDAIPTQFTWTPPAPATMFSRLHYEMIITEIKPGQKAAEALQDNMSFYNTEELANNFMTYPASLPSFEKEKWYAWQVTARNGKSYAAKTETWVFKVKQPEQPVVTPETSAYLLMQDDVTGAYTISTDRVKIKYFSPDPEHETDVVFTDEKGNTIKQVKQKIRQGDNYLDFGLNKNFRQGVLYKVIITDQMNKSHALTFSITKK